MNFTKPASPGEMTGHRPTSDNSTADKLLLGVTLFLAGFLAISYEVSWHRMLSLALGATLRSAALVLSAYMLGMGLGSWLFGRLADRAHRPARHLAWLHWAMALSGLWGLALISAIPAFYRAAGGGPAVEAAVQLIAVLALLPGAAAAGGMMPATARAYIGKKAGLGRGIGTLYALEALGSVAGGAAAGYLMIRFLGQANTILASMAAGAAAGAVLFALGGGGRRAADPDRKQEGEEKRPKRNIRLLLIALALGLAGMGLQVIWNRAVRIYLPNSSYTFATVAAVYLAGLFAGNLAFRAAAGRIRDLSGWLFAGLATLALSIAGSVLLLDRVPDLFLFPWAGMFSFPSARVFLPPLLVTAGLALLPTAVIGFCSPLACRIYVEGSKAVGRDVGLLRGANILGSALGPAAAGLLILPLAGVSRSLWLMAAIAAAAAAVAANLEKRRRVQTLSSLSGAAALLALAFFSRPVMVLPPSMHREAGASSRSDRIIHYRETAEGTVIVAEDRRTGIRACHVDNSGVVGTSYDAIKAVKMLGHLPFLCGARPGKALVIGFGIGVTASTVAGHQGVERVDCVEIAPGLRLASVHFREFNRDVLENPRIRFIDGDGRAYLNRTRERYRVISADPTHPTLGCAQLYTREYFELCRRSLERDGIICQYLPFHGLTTEGFVGIVATFASVFPHSSLWLGHSHGVLLGSPEPLEIDFADWKRRAGALDDPLFYRDPYALAACLLQDGEGVARLAGGAAVCTDDLNYLEFFDPRAKDQSNWEANMALAAADRVGPKSMFAGVEDTALLSRHRAGMRIFIGAMAAQNRGDFRGMAGAMKQAVLAAPENEEFRFLLQQQAGRGAW